MTRFKIIAVNADGTGEDHSWGDPYEVHAETYEQAEAKVLGLEPVTDGNPLTGNAGRRYVKVVRAWVKTGWRWDRIDPAAGETAKEET